MAQQHEKAPHPDENAGNAPDGAAPQAHGAAALTAPEAHIILGRSLRDAPTAEWFESVMVTRHLPGMVLRVSAFAEAQPLDNHPSRYVALYQRLEHAGVPIVASYAFDSLGDPDAIAGYTYLFAKPEQLSARGREGELGALLGRPAVQIAGYLSRLAPYPEAPQPSVRQIATGVGHTGLREMLSTSQAIATTHVGLEESPSHEVLGPNSDPAHWQRVQQAMDTLRAPEPEASLS